MKKSNVKTKKAVKMTNRAMMKEAHKRAKTYEGDYSACLTLALRELQRELREMNVSATSDTLSKPDFSKVSPATIKLVNDYLLFKNPTSGKSRFSAKNIKELESKIFDGSDDKGTIANTLFYAPKTFKAIAKIYTKTDIYLDADDVYMSGVEKVMAKIDKGERVESLTQVFKFEVLNIVKKENRRMENNEYTSMNAEYFKESSLYTNSDSSEYRQIPVDRIIMKRDMSKIFDSEQLEIIDLLLEGKKKVEIDKHFGQRMDRKYVAMQDYLSAYIRYSYSEYVYTK